MIIYNLPGLAMFLAAFGTSWGISHLAGFGAKGALMMLLAGPVAAALDVAWRRRWGRGDMLRGAAGGSIFFVPVWAWGFVWTVVGTFHLLSPGGATH